MQLSAFATLDESPDTFPLLLSAAEIHFRASALLADFTALFPNGTRFAVASRELLWYLHGSGFDLGSSTWAGLPQRRLFLCWHNHTASAGCTSYSRSPRGTGLAGELTHGLAGFVRFYSRLYVQTQHYSGIITPHSAVSVLIQSYLQAELQWCLQLLFLSAAPFYGSSLNQRLDTTVPSLDFMKKEIFSRFPPITLQC